MNFPNPTTETELLVWLLLSPETVDRRTAAYAELLRRLGSAGAVRQAVEERLAIPVPLGLLDWEPERLRGTGHHELWKVRTESGSIYQFLRTPEGRWWMQGTRAASRDAQSANVAIGRPQPFPPRLGQSMTIPLLEVSKLRLTTPVVEVSGPAFSEESEEKEGGR